MATESGHAMSPGAIALENVTLAFGEGRNAVTALQSLSLTLRPGDFLSVLGPSGCGKSSLINTNAGFQRPQAGEVSVDGEQVVRPGPDRGVVFQQPTLFPWKLVWQNVNFGLKFRNVRRAQRDQMVDEILRKVGLSEFGRHYPAQLSGGMQQRVGLARVLVNKPRVMLMDEPFSSLDAQTRLMMQELLLEVWTEYGMTVLFVTHDIDEAIYLGSQVAVLTRRPGRLKALFDVPLPRPRTIDTLVSKDFMKLKRTCMDLLREEMLGALLRQKCEEEIPTFLAIGCLSNRQTLPHSAKPTLIYYKPNRKRNLQ
jgi:NitT/TauT family transport system ATP-binding protein